MKVEESKIERLLWIGLIVFGAIAFIFAVLHYLRETGELFYAPLAGLFAIFACLCLCRQQGIKFKDKPLKLKRLRYAYLLLFVVTILDIILFCLAFSQGVYSF